MGKVKFIPPTRLGLGTKSKQRNSIADEENGHKPVHQKKCAKRTSTDEAHLDVYKFTSTSPKKVLNRAQQNMTQRKKRKKQAIERVLKDIYKMKKDIANLRKKGKCDTAEP